MLSSSLSIELARQPAGQFSVLGYILGDESSLCGSANDEGRESVMSDQQGTGGGGGANHHHHHHHHGQKRKVPKVFSKEAITKFRAWLFQNLTVRLRYLVEQQQREREGEGAPESE
jgi:hypothetical protein